MMKIFQTQKHNSFNLDQDLDIRLLKKKDLTALEWEGQYVHFRNVYAQAYQQSQKGQSILWVAELSEYGIIGQVFIQLICDRNELANGKTRAYLYSFRIKTDFQNLGIGSMILTNTESDLKKRGYRQISLNVAKENSRAQSFYYRHGFRTIAHEAGCWSYKDHKGVTRHVNEPAWRMFKSLD